MELKLLFSEERLTLLPVLLLFCDDASTLGAEVFRPRLGSGIAGLMKRSLRRPWKNGKKVEGQKTGFEVLKVKFSAAHCFSGKILECAVKPYTKNRRILRQWRLILNFQFFL